MTTVRDVYDFLDSIAPFAGQEPWDNSGLQVGNWGAQVRRAMVCLDVTPLNLMADARSGKTVTIDLVVSHHPVIFEPRRQLTGMDPAYMLASMGISAIASHTPLDIAAGGVNDVLAEQLGLLDVRALPGGVRVGHVPEMAPDALARMVSQRLGTQVRFVSGRLNVSTVAVCGGAGGGFLPEIYGQADAYVTGEVKHSEFMEAGQRHAMTLIAAGHYETEIPVIPLLTKRLREAFPEVEWRIAPERGEIQYA